ncbi:MAG: hypothetical protein RLZZ200_2587 [Pseudomonadota bacterium]|jgi:uncharacterized protein YcfJ
MKLGLVSMSVAALLLGSQVAAAHDHGWGRHKDYDRGYERGYDRGYDRFARVIDVDPIYDRVRVVETVPECRRSLQRERGGVVLHRDIDPAATIVGGVLGAVVGSNVASRYDRGIGTVAGALVGSAIGNEVGARGYREEYIPARTYETERCYERPVEYIQPRQLGFGVTYLFEGQQFRARLPYDPGRSLRVDGYGRPIGP